MGLFNQLAQYREWKTGVQHCTFNPEGPGVVRIHLIPPKFRLFRNPEYIVILNGYYMLPLGYSWAVLLSCLMKEVNEFDGKPIGDDDWERILSETVKNTGRAYPMIGKNALREDLDVMTDILFTVAKGGDPGIEIRKLSLRAYASNMVAPHRMDLMISAMTDRNGAWHCNQKCLFCYAAGQKLGEGKELSTEEWKKIISRLRDAGVPMVTFTGGEPTLRSDLPELVDSARWFVTRLNTNGVAMTDELAKKLRDASLDSVQITLYSHEESIHNELVGSTHFQDTVRGIGNAVRNGLDVSVNTPLCRKNADYRKTVEFLHSLGVRFVTVSGLICTGMAEEKHGEYDLGEEELLTAVRDAKEFCDANDMEMDFTSPGLIRAEALEALSLHVPACGAAISNMAIAPDGTVIPCQSWLNAGAGLGNMLTDDFASIWDHPFCRKLRAMSEEEAQTCPFRNAGAEGGKENGNG